MSRLLVSVSDGCAIGAAVPELHSGPVCIDSKPHKQESSRLVALRARVARSCRGFVGIVWALLAPIYALLARIWAFLGLAVNRIRRSEGLSLLFLSGAPLFPLLVYSLGPFFLSPLLQK